MNGLEVLKSDHKKIEALFGQFAVYTDSTATGEKLELFLLIRQEFKLHAAIEEAVFYPYFSERAEFRDLIHEAYDEHGEIKSLLDEIAETAAEDEFDSRVTGAIEAVRQHLGEEETQLFPRVEEYCSREELEVLGARLEQEKTRLGTLTAA